MLRGGVLPLDATNGHGNLPENLPTHGGVRAGGAWAISGYDFASRLA